MNIADLEVKPDSRTGQAIADIAQSAKHSLIVSLNRSSEDPKWDTFLQATASGHFQQSSLWALVKAAEGWRPVRLVITADDTAMGGFQILVRRTRLGKVGYIYKG